VLSAGDSLTSIACTFVRTCSAAVNPTLPPLRLVKHDAILSGAKFGGRVEPQIWAVTPCGSIGTSGRAERSGGNERLTIQEEKSGF
jgi:hypothetical protein